MVLSSQGGRTATRGGVIQGGALATSALFEFLMDAVGFSDTITVAQTEVISNDSATPAVIQHQAQVNGATNSHTVTLPSAPTAGNLLVIVMRAMTASISVPSGWTLVESSVASSTLTLFVFAKLAGPSESSTFTVTTGGAAAASQMLGYEVSGAGIAGRSSDSSGSVGAVNTFDFLESFAGSWTILTSGQSADNGGAESATGGFIVRDSGTLTTMIVSDKFVNSSILASHAWTTARDVVAVQVAFVASATPDTFGLTDGIVVSGASGVTAADTFGLVDSFSSSLTQALSTADGLTWTDTISVSQTTGEIIGSDALGMVDSSGVVRSLVAPGSDPFGWLESSTIAVSVELSSSDPTGATDSLTIETGTPAPALAVFESRGAQTTARGGVVVGGSIALATNPVVTDTLDRADSIAITRVIVGDFVDVLVWDDSTPDNIIAFESVGWTDNGLVEISSPNLSLVEALGRTDTLTHDLLGSPGDPDPLQWGDNLTIDIRDTNYTGSDASGRVDTLTATQTLSTGVGDSNGWTDSTTFEGTKLVLLSDSYVTSDTAGASVQTQAVVGDTSETTDSGTIVVSGSSSATDSSVWADTTTIVLVSDPTGIDSSTRTDSLAITAGVSISVLSVFGQTDSSTSEIPTTTELTFNDPLTWVDGKVVLPSSGNSTNVVVRILPSHGPTVRILPLTPTCRV